MDEDKKMFICQNYSSDNKREVNENISTTKFASIVGSTRCCLNENLSQTPDIQVKIEKTDEDLECGVDDNKLEKGVNFLIDQRNEFAVSLDNILKVEEIKQELIETEDEKYIKVSEKEESPKKKKPMSRFYCGYCAYSAGRKYHLKSHINAVHTKTDWYKCETCGVLFTRTSDLRRHIRTLHTDGNTIYKCPHCNFASIYKGNLTSHLNVKHIRKKIFKCELCTYKGARKADLQCHFNNIHAKTKSFTCEYCDYSCSNRKGLNWHLNMKHCDKHLIRCSDCDFSCIQKNQLRHHTLEKHTESEKFGCDKCEFLALRKATLRVHIKSKHPTTIYKCEYCTYSTGHKHSLKKHVDDIHIKRNIYMCEYCDFTAVRKSSVKLHTNAKHTKTKVAKCQYCDFSTFHRSYIVQHLRIKHSKEI